MLQTPVEKTIPDYSASELDCIANGWEQGVVTPCVSEALRDWMVLVGI